MCSQFLKLRRLIRRLETQFGVSINRPDVVTIVVLFLEDWPLYIDMLFISIVENCLCRITLIVIKDKLNVQTLGRWIGYFYFSLIIITVIFCIYRALISYLILCVYLLWFHFTVLKYDGPNCVILILIDDICYLLSLYNPLMWFAFVFIGALIGLRLH